MLKIIDKNDVKIASFIESDRLNIPVANKVKQQLNDLFKIKRSKVILNFENIQFIDSSGFAALISALKASRESESKFLICNINKEVMELVELMKLDSIFDIQKDIKSALGHI